jgi:hypothetical protein
MKNNKSINIIILYFSFLFVIFLCFPINRIFGIEVSLPGLSSNATLPQYIIYFFYFGISIAGVLSLVSFTIGAIGFMVSSNKPESASSAKDRMKGAVLGLVLTLVSFIILRTINPILIGPSLTPLGEMAGVFYTGELGTAPAPFTNSNTFDVLSQGYVDIIYKCTADGYSPPLLIWEFPNPGLEGGNENLNTVKVVRKECGETEAIPPGSFKMAFETPGVYYCLGGCDGNMCSGYMSYANTASQDTIGNLFAENIGGVRIVNNSTDKLYYGAIFHLGEYAEGVGSCSPFLINPTSESKCLPNTNPIISNSVDIFKINLEPASSGDGVSFYSEPYGWNKGSRAGYWILSGQDIADIVVAGVPLVIQDYNYTNIDRPSGYPIYCKSFQSCPGSIKINGKYLVVLYSEVYPDGSGYCQKFTKDVPNLNVQEIITAGYRYINYIVIVPIK